MDTHPEKNPADAREIDLIRRAARGDAPAFEAYCARIEGPLFGYAFGMTRSPQEAEDIVQESLLRLYRLLRQGGLRDFSSARSLVFTTAHNLSVDHVRRWRRRVVPIVERRSARASEAAEQALLREQVERAMAELPESHRAALMLREFGGLSYEEIASALGANRGEVRTWIYRARKRLAQLLDRDGQYIGEHGHGV
ncbi:MAG: RNA polymerase sigma factor [FCB group bacterium]|jgi:RNA polymerase sigma-70 factor (ECF subfamily)|nr:RNA polymerase sigma factor [FCB group bacterium]